MFGEELPKDEIAKADTVLEIARVMSKNPDLTESDIPEIRTVEEYKEAAKLKVPYIKIEGKMYRYTGGLNEYQPFNDVAIIYNQYEYARIAPTVKQAISADNAQDWPDFYMMRSWQAQPNQGAQRDQSGYGQQGRAGGAQAINQTDSVMDSMGVGLDLYEQRAATGPATQGRGSPGTTGGRYPTGLQRSGYPGTAGMPGGRY